MRARERVITLAALLRARSVAAAAPLLVGALALGCGASKDIIVDSPGSAAGRDEWPAPATSPPDAASVNTVLGAADGAEVRVRAYLIAINLPCAPCNTTLGAHHEAPHEEGIGHARASLPVAGPGCDPCPPPAATFSDDRPKAAALNNSPPLRATGGAEGLQARHVGHMFLLTGIFHAAGRSGPELEVTDVRALADQ
jgi:hypothetical protein